LSSDPVCLVQLPFPSQADPDPVLAAYYVEYGRLFRQLVPGYEVGSGDLWEAPLWVAHLDAAIGREDTKLLDLSRSPAELEPCLTAIEQHTPAQAYLYLSPLAQNFDLAVGIGRALRGTGRRTVLGGNMARLAPVGDFDVVYQGQATADLRQHVEVRGGSVVGMWPRRGVRQAAAGFRPRYRLLRSFGHRVPLVRLNGSHGCLLACTFCGDGWSRQLHVVPSEDLAAELEEIEATFPNIRCIYIGDKTFGQSRAAVENLIGVLGSRRGRYTLIIQTHVSLIDDWLLDAMDRLGVNIVEMGVETADPDVLRQVRKAGGAQQYQRAIERLHRHGKAVFLNVMGGLPHQTEAAHVATMTFLSEVAEYVHAHNLYNFVPYPETPLFESLKPRIVDWDFANWREDRPVVFEPYVLSRQRAWEQFLELVALCARLGRARADRFDDQMAVLNG
jgi:uncharacterized radical SAM superfamily protein